MSGRSFFFIFDSVGELEHAVKLARSHGVARFDAASPYAIESLFAQCPRKRDHTLPGFFFPRLNVIGLIALVGGFTGAATGFGMQWLASSWAFPLDSGGRPDFSWPNFVPVTFELAVLTAALSIFLSLLLLLRLPEPWHPYFDSPEFDLSAERFYLAVEAREPGAEELSRAIRAQLPQARLTEVAA